MVLHVMREGGTLAMVVVVVVVMVAVAVAVVFLGNYRTGATRIHAEPRHQWTHLRRYHDSSHRA